ncbi:MAG: asparagine synthetase B [Nitrospirae bacterium]|nr:asparagine synthetase B [Nitrospirota bacterium]
MSGIFGILQRDGGHTAPSVPEIMRRAMAGWEDNSCDVQLDGPAALGQMRLFRTPDARYEMMPHIYSAEGFIFCAAGRVDNRDELIADCELRIVGYEKSDITDFKLLLHAYRKWGEDCPKRIYGDWSLAAWHPRERRLFISRDHYGNTSLYYYADPRLFAFASDRKALLALNPGLIKPIKIDELYLAQVLISWPACHGERTIHTPIKRLPPAHCLTVTHERLDVRQYWLLEETPELRLPRRKDYVEAFRDLFDEAVRCRLRVSNCGGAQGNGGQSIAATLSGGLDSGSVTATAAHFLHDEGKRLAAFTSVPLSDTGIYAGKRFGDELPFARATARHAGNVDLHQISARTISPIQAIRRMLEIYNEPGHAAGNFFWILELEETARANGCRVLLTGQMGNAGISWTGDVFSQPFSLQLSHYGWRRWVKERAKLIAPDLFLKAYRRARMPGDYSWCKSSSIHPDFARRINLREQRLNDPAGNPRTPQERRFQILKPGRSFGGALHARMGAAHGLEIRDPTADARVLAFTISVPDHIFIDPETGMDRMLIRDAMKGRLPDEVRLNRRRGRQAGDLVPRLRACAAEVETALDELAQGPAADYLDVPYMFEVWRMIQTQDTPEAFRKAGTVLTRGIMAGLFVNGFGKWQ